jgi:hypothetical protein
MTHKLINQLGYLAAPLAAMLLFTACGGESSQGDVVQPGEVAVSQGEDPGLTQPAEGTQLSLTAGGREFFVDGATDANPDIVVQQGDTVAVTLCVTEGNHDWVVDEFDVATDVVGADGDCSTVEFVADQVGEFEYYCSVGNHRAEGMYGTLIVD